MASNNSVTLQGNMTKPEVRSTASGKTITSARMVIKTYGDKDDMWVTIKMWGALGENLNESFPQDKNTMRVSVQGRLTEEKTQMTVTADSVSAMLDWQTVSGVQYKGDGSVQESNTYTGQGVTGAKEVLGAVEKKEPAFARPMEEIGDDEAPF